MTKRKKFILSAFVLSLGLMAIQYIQTTYEYGYPAVLVFFILTYIVSAWALIEDLKGIEWVTIVPVPALYATSVALFYFILEEHLIARLVILTVFGIGMYALYLTSNIYSVAAMRTIQLLRAAHAVGFLLTLLTLVLFYNTIFSLRLSFLLNGLLVLLITFPLVLSALWSIKLEERISKKIWWYSIVMSLVVLELALAISFLPLTVWVASLFLATIVYVGLGILQHELADRLFSRTLKEYITVGILVLLATLAVTPWK